MLNPSSGQQVARGRVNDEPVALEPGKYHVQLSGLDTDPVAIEMTAGNMAEVRLNDEGELLPPATGQAQ